MGQIDNRPKRLMPATMPTSAKLSIRMTDFETGQAVLRPEHIEWLATVAIPAIGRHSRCYVDVVGFASKIGNAAFNLVLSQKRAQAVLSTFTRIGRNVFHKNVVRVRSFDFVGETGYVAKADDNSGAERAVEVHVYLDPVTPPRPHPAPPPKPPQPQPGPPAPSGPPNVLPPVLEQDIWVEFLPTDHRFGEHEPEQEEGLRNRINRPGYLQRHLPIQAHFWFGTHDSTVPVDMVSQAIMGSRLGGAKGKILIVGSSVGGTNALDLAARLTAKAELVGPITYLAISDGAFFERDGDIEGFNPFFIRTPIIRAGEKHSFYQLFGHNLFKTRNGFGEGDEFHGPMRDFNNHPLDDDCKDIIDEYNKITFPSFDDKVKFSHAAHVRATGKGQHFAKDRMSELVGA